MADSTINVTPGTGASLKTSVVDSTLVVQYVREIPADTSSTPGSWTLSTTASTSVITADVQRVGILMMHNGTSRVYIRFDATSPTTATGGYHWYLDPGERWEVPQWACRTAWSMIAASGPSGTVNWLLGTKA